MEKNSNVSPLPHTHIHKNCSNSGHVRIKEQSLSLACTYKVHLERHDINH